MYRFELTNSRRIDCPHCGKHNKYSAYMDKKTGELAPLEYGMCSSCQKYVIPPDNYVKDEITHIEDSTLAYYEADTINTVWIEKYYNPKGYIENNFIEGLEAKFDKKQVRQTVDLYKLGRFYDNGVVFPYMYTDKHCCTAKIMFYDKNLSRIKLGKKAYPKWLHNLIYTDEKGYYRDFNNYDEEEMLIPFKLKLCLFGNNQIINDNKKTICLVESEKTAIIMSIVLPEFIWVATGGKTMIQDYKFLFFSGRKCLVFPDLSKDDNVFLYWYEKLTTYSNKYGYDFQFIDYADLFDNEMLTTFKTNGRDVADFVLMDFYSENKYLEYLKNKLKNYVSMDTIESKY